MKDIICNKCGALTLRDDLDGLCFVCSEDLDRKIQVDVQHRLFKAKRLQINERANILEERLKLYHKEY